MGCWSLFDRTSRWGLVLKSAGAALVLAFGQILRTHFAGYTLVMALCRPGWRGRILWLLGRPVFQVCPVVGRFSDPDHRRRAPGTRAAVPARCSRCDLFGSRIPAGLAGGSLDAVQLRTGLRLAGLGMILLAAWLLRYDVARYNLRKPGLTGYIAACLFSGFLWLGVGGALRWLAWAGSAVRPPGRSTTPSCTPSSSALPSA